MTLIDHAEEIWGMLKEGKTQQQVADEIGWNRNKVKHYAALETLLPNVWGVIVPHIQKIGTTQVVDNGTRDVPNGTISEGLLRNILDLNEQHQLEMQNQCAEIKIRAERRAGEIIPEQTKDKGGGDTSTGNRVLPVQKPKLSDLGISKSQSYRWQEIASIPEETFETYISETNGI